MVEHHLAKVRVAGSNPVVRSKEGQLRRDKRGPKILRAYRQERFDAMWQYVVPGAVPRVKQLVKDNRCDDFIEVRP